MNNYVTEKELKGYIPELSKYLWNGENDFSKQRIQAEQIVVSDLSNKGYLIRQLQPKLYLGTNAIEDNINALRFVCTSTGAGTVTLWGSNDEDYEIVKTLTFVKAETQSHIITNPFKYYKVDSETFTSYLVEITFDRLFAYKWLELILMDSFKERDDSYYERMTYFKESYQNLLNGMVINIDSNEDGEIDETEQSSTNSIDIVR